MVQSIHLQAVITHPIKVLALTSAVASRYRGRANDVTNAIDYNTDSHNDFLSLTGYGELDTLSSTLVTRWTNVLDYNFSLNLYSPDNQQGKIVAVRVPDLSNKGTNQFREITVQ